MTNSTISTSQVTERFTSTTQDVTVISSERVINRKESINVKNAETTQKKSSEVDFMHLLEQKLSQRSYITGYKGF